MLLITIRTACASDTATDLQKQCFVSQEGLGCGMAQSSASMPGARPTKLSRLQLMVNETLGPLTATEARAFKDVVGKFGTSDHLKWWLLAIGFQCCTAYLAL